MYKLSADDNSVSIKFASMLSSIDRAVEDTVTMIPSLKEYDTGLFIQVIRELLLNAIEHGNKNIAEKKISYDVEMISPGRYTISVEDEGHTLKPEHLEITSEMIADSPRKKGLVIIHNCCDNISLDESTGAIKAVITLPKKLVWEVNRSDGLFEVIPSRDISAATLITLKQYLREWIDSTIPVCELNLKSVTSLDSISLSLLISFSKDIQSRTGKELVISNVNAELMMVFNLTQMKRLYSITGIE